MTARTAKGWLPGAAALVLLAIGVVAPPIAAGEFELKLTVEESAGLARANAPVSGGVPLPRGLVKNPAALKLLGPGGEEVPAQFSTINRWASDGSVMWLLVQSTATVPAKGKAVFTLRPGPAAARRKLLKVVEGADVITVETGPLKFTVSKKKFNLIDSAWVDGQQVIAAGSGGGSSFALKKNGEVYTSSATAPREVLVEEKGPERATILIRGLHGPEKGKGALPYCYGYMVRVRAYAGQKFLRISYALTDDALPAIGSPEISEGVISVPLALPGQVNAFFGSDKENVSGALAAGKKAALVVENQGSAKLTGLGAGSAPSGGLGWAGASNGKVSAGLAVRYLRENHPAALGVRREKDTVWLELRPWPAEVETERYLDVCSHKTYELQLSFAKGDGAVEKGGELFADYHDGLRFWPPAEWTAATKAWGDFGGLAMLDETAEKMLGRLKPYRTTGWRLFGSSPVMINGMEYSPGGGYEPLLTDVQFYNGYMQTGWRRLFDQLERTSWHWRDRRKFHREDDVSKSRWGGMSGSFVVYTRQGHRAYKALQPGCYLKKFLTKPTPWHTRAKWGVMDTSHFSVDEVANYYYLTGDRQSLFALNKYAELAACVARDSIKQVEEKGSSRRHGWILRALITGYEATGEKRWMELSRKAARAICKGQDKTAGTISPVDKKQTPFMATVVAMALGRYYRHHPEEEVRDAIQGMCDWLCHDVAAKIGGFSYQWSKDNPGRCSGSGNRCMSTMAWMYTATGRKRYMVAADKHKDTIRRSKMWRWQLYGFGQEYADIKTTKRADAVLPAAVKDLTAEALGGGKVKLTWTAPGDDGTTGRAAEYQVKHAAKAIKERSDWRNKSATEISFWAATNCKGEPKPAAAGARASFTVTGLKPGTHWFALKTYDEQPNQSDLSNVVKVEVK